MNSSAKCEKPAIVLTGCDSGGGGGGGAEAAYGDCDDAAYSLNVNVNLNTSVAGLLAAEGAGPALRTPEILNSLIAMTNPLDQYAFDGSEKSAPAGYKSGSCNDSNSSTSTGSPATSPAAGTPPSIQKTCSDLIKAGLKLTIESKRKMSGSECSDAGLGCVKRLKKEEAPSDEDYDSGHTSVSKSDGLTPEDEERRRRRRERNKIAATKCRLKKRERTVNLVTESEVLESQNHDLKSQLQELEVQRRQLLDMLSVHAATCVKLGGGGVGGGGSPYAPPAPYPAYDAAASPYIRPESADVLASGYAAEPALDAYLARPPDEYRLPADAYGDAYLVRPDCGEYYEELGYRPPAADSLAAAPAPCHYADPQKLGQGLNDGCLA